MKSFLRLLAAGLLVCTTSLAYSQSRDVGARRLKLDDGVGGVLTVSYTGPGNSTLVIPPGAGTTVPLGTLAGQTLAWNGTVWQAMSNLLNTGGNLSVPTGNVTVTAGNLTLSSGVFTGNGSGITTINASNISSGSLALPRITTSGAAMNQAIMYDGANLVYGFPAAGSLVLPFSQTASNASTLFDLTNTGTGRAASFTVNNAANTGPTLEATTNSSTSSTAAVYATSTGAATAVIGLMQGTGVGGSFGNTNAANLSPALVAFTTGMAPAAQITTFGTSAGATVSITNAANTSIALNASTNGTGIGIRGTSVSNTGVDGISTTGAGVSGTTAGGLVGGVRGTNTTSGPGVWGSSSNGNGVFGTATAIGASGVRGEHNASGQGLLGLSNTGAGVWGQSTTGNGVYGLANSAAAAVRGDNVSSGVGIRGDNSGTGYGVWGSASGVNGLGVYGTAAGGANSAGVFGTNSGTGVGVWGEGTGTNTAVYGISSSGLGVGGVTTSASSAGVSGANNGTGAGVNGLSPNGTGGSFSGLTAGAFNGTSIGVQITNGSLIGSYEIVASGGAISNDKCAIFVINDGTGAAATATAPAGTNGKILFISTDDAQGVTIATFTIMGSGVLMYANGAWRGPL
jgi:hypothetical protein